VENHLTFGKVTHETAMMIGWFLLSAADEQQLVEVTANVFEQSYANVDLPLKEAKQWIFDIFCSTTHALKCLHNNIQKHFKNNTM
jgi:hypothetical protein